ncbi:MAG: SIMPL domain-containing protein [Bacteroidota bacterium]|nr:SIMPL domain-containing protein [Bacteroidota bacterium]
MRIIAAPLIAGFCVIIAFWIVSSAIKYKTRSVETIVVTGLADKDFVSDLIVWNGSYARKSLDLKSAYAALKQDETAIRQYLKGKGIGDGEMVFSSVVINKEFNTRSDDNGKQIGQEFTGYNLTQTVKVESVNVDKVEKISREVTELIESGIELNSSPPDYYYSKLTDVKIDLLGKASADARSRAQTIAKNSGTSLGKLRKANMGVFQITGKNSNEDYSYGGAFNTSQKNKTGSITIKMEFATD